MNQQALSSLIWSVADLLRGDFKQSEYGRVILPFTVLRRLNYELAPTKEAAHPLGAILKQVFDLPTPFSLRDEKSVRCPWASSGEASGCQCS